jgi:hypothetical protein
MSSRPAAAVDGGSTVGRGGRVADIGIATTADREVAAKSAFDYYPELVETIGTANSRDT